MSDGSRTCLCGEKIYVTLGGQACERDSYQLHHCADLADGAAVAIQECVCGVLVATSREGRVDFETNLPHDHELGMVELRARQKAARDAELAEAAQKARLRSKVLAQAEKRATAASQAVAPKRRRGLA